MKDNFIARLVQKKIFDFHFSWKMFGIAMNDKSDYIIVGGSYWIPNAAMVMIFNKLKGKKIAYFTEPLFEVKSKLKYAVKWLFLRLVNINCSAVFCVGKKAAVSFSSFGVNIPKFVIPYNIDSKSFVNLDEQKLLELKNRYKSNNEVIILSSGSLISRKGMDILIKAVKNIPDPKLKLIIIGDGPLKKELKALSNHDERIIFAGFASPDEIPYYFGIADVFAFASRYDGWAVVINEAIAANVPVVSSDAVGAAKELITSSEVGLICESDNVEAFTQAIAALTSDTVKREQIKTSAKKLIPLISSDYNAKYVFEIFTSILK